MTGSITKAIEEWKKGNAEAAFDIDRQFRSWMLSLVRCRRDPSLQRRIGSHDIVYAALNSFLAGVPEGKFPKLENRDDVRRILATIVCRHLGSDFRKIKSAKRCVEREIAWISDQPAREGSAADIVDHEDFLEKVPDLVSDIHPHAIRILELSLEGLKPDEISRSLSMESDNPLSTRSVQLIIGKMCDKIMEYAVE